MKNVGNPMRWGFWTEVASAAAAGLGAAIVGESGSGIREYLSDKRAEAAEAADPGGGGRPVRVEADEN